MPKLDNIRWEGFAQELAAGRKRADAYLAAGFNCKSRQAAATRAGTLFRGKPEIQARVLELQQELQSASLRAAKLDRDWVIGGLQDNYERAMQTKEVLDREGNATGEYQYNGSVANRSLELAGKELGMFADRMMIGTLDGEIENMTVDQIRDFIRVACNEVGLRVVDMDEKGTREWIVSNAPRVGLSVTDARGQGSDGSQEPKDGGVSSVH